MSYLRQAIAREIPSFFHEPRLAIEFTLLTEMRQGDAFRLHADNARLAEEGRWVPNHTR